MIHLIIFKCLQVLIKIVGEIVNVFQIDAYQ